MVFSTSSLPLSSPPPPTSDTLSLSLSLSLPSFFHRQPNKPADVPVIPDFDPEELTAQKVCFDFFSSLFYQTLVFFFAHLFPPLFLISKPEISTHSSANGSGDAGARAREAPESSLAARTGAPRAGAPTAAASSAAGRPRVPLCPPPRRRRGARGGSPQRPGRRGAAAAPLLPLLLPLSLPPPSRISRLLLRLLPSARSSAFWSWASLPGTPGPLCSRRRPRRPRRRSRAEALPPSQHRGQAPEGLPRRRRGIPRPRQPSSEAGEGAAPEGEAALSGNRAPGEEEPPRKRRRRRRRCSSRRCRPGSSSPIPILTRRPRPRPRPPRPPPPPARRWKKSLPSASPRGASR